MADGGFSGPDSQTVWGWAAAAALAVAGAAWGVIVRASQLSRMAREARDGVAANREAIELQDQKLDKIAEGQARLEGQMEILIKKETAK